jgi:hypothetical protein
MNPIIKENRKRNNVGKTERQTSREVELAFLFEIENVHLKKTWRWNMFDFSVEDIYD